MFRDKSKKLLTPKNKINIQDSEPPLGSLVLEIDSLKKELKSIKSKKHLNYNQCHHVQSSINLTEKNLSQVNDSKDPQIKLQEINYKQRDKKLKMDIELNKLRKYIIRGNSTQISEQINIVIRLINQFNAQIITDLEKYKERYFEAKLQVEEIQNDNHYREYREKYKELIKINDCLELEVKDLKNSVINKIGKKPQNSNTLTKMQEQLNLIYKQKVLVSSKNKQMNQIIFEMTNQLQAANQKIKIYEISLQKKESHLLLLEEDVSYLRIQSQKFRGQKKQMEVLYEQLNRNYRQFKNNSQGEIDKLNRQNSKLQYELNLRRNQCQQLIQIQSQKNLLYKQTQELRQDLERKNFEVSQIKSLLHQQQKKTLTIQSELYRKKTQLQKLERNLEFSKNQLKNLYEEVQQLSKTNQSMRSVYSKNKNKQCSKTDDKVKALDQIQEMIRKHKLQSTNI